MEDNLKEVFGLDDIDDEVDVEDIEDASQDDVVDHEDGDVTDEGDEGAGEGSLSEGAATPQQNREVNQIAAAARRQAEQEKADVERILAQAQKEVELLKGVLGKSGYTGSVEEIADQAIADANGETIEVVRARRIAEEAKLKEMIDNHPAVKEAERLRQELLEQQSKVMLDNELKNIQRINPEIRSLADLQNLGDRQEAFDALIRGGLHIDKAYEIVAGPQKTTAPAVDTKSHIKQVNGHGDQGNALIVPSEERAMIKEMMPNITDKEIDEWYKKQKK